MRVVILGVGNSLKSDDWIGCYATEILQKELKLKNMTFIVGSISPEAYAEKIAKLKPDKVIILDAVEMGLNPGQVEVVDLEKIRHGPANTHRPSLKIMIDYLKKTTDADIKIVGIQPKNVNFGETISEEVKESIPVIKDKIVDIVLSG